MAFSKQLTGFYFLFYSRNMKTNSFRQVFDRAKRRIRGLWVRNGSFYVQTTVQDPVTGLKKVTRLPLSAATDIDSAKTEAGKLREKIAEGETVHGRQGPAFKSYREHYKKNNHKKPKTVYNEDYFLRAWQDFLGEDTKIGNISKQNVLAFRTMLKDGGYSPRTINLHVIALRNLFKLAWVEGYVKTLPTDGVVQVRVVQKERVLLTNEQIEQICAEALTNHKRNGQSFADFIRLMAYCGGRTTEVLKLKWSDIDFSNEVLIFRGENTKNSQTRRVNFNNQLQSHLEDMKGRRFEDEPYLFPSSRTDNPVVSFKVLLRIIRDDLELPHLTNHLFRHYFVSMCVMSGIDFMTIANWVGHKDGGILIGKVYGHLNSEHTKRMAGKVSFKQS